MDHKDVYICYNGADLDWVKQLAEQIESETIDGNLGSRKLAVFFDKWDIAPGQSLIDRMNEGMRSARHVVAVLSPEFINAEWPRFEWKHIVSQDPNNTQGRLIPLRLRDRSIDALERIDLCAPFRELRYIDFRKGSEFRRGFVELVRRIRNLPQERGRRLAPLAASTSILPSVPQPEVSWLPDIVSDLVLSNLFPVVGLPLQIWSAPTQFREKKDVWKAVPGAETFILREQRLYAFADLRSEATNLRKAVEAGSVGKPESRHDWFMRDDRSNWLMAMLNSSLSSHLRQLNIRQDGKGRFFFCPGDNMSDRKWQMKEGRPRTVAAKKGNSSAGTGFWVHHAARMQFKRVGERLFLSVEPLYLFTTDGTVAVPGKSSGKLALLWGGRQQNPDILRNLLFWGDVLAKNERTIRIQTGGEQLVMSPIPASALLDRGIAFDEVRIKALLSKEDTDLDKAAVDVQMHEREEEDGDEGDEHTPFE